MYPAEPASHGSFASPDPWQEKAQPAEHQGSVEEA
jgi:hypothetical protein